MRQWHISARVDLMGYAFSWAWVFVPLLFLGAARWDYMVYYLLIVAVTDVHRHFGLPYVYMDKEIRRRYPIRFYLFPAALLAAWVLSPWLSQSNYYMSGVQILALLSWIFLLSQVLRLDGANAISGSQIVAGFGAAFLGGLVLTGVVGWSTVDPGWWWLSGSWILSYLLRRRARSVVPFMIFGLGVVAAFLGGAISKLGGEQGIWITYVLHTVAVFAGLWNFYHVYMQKYGIMRLYNAKSGSETKVAGWVDKIMLFAWLPLYLAWLGPLYREVALEKLGRASAVLPPTMFYAAEALMEWVVHDLERARSWDDVLQGRETSGFRHGSTRVVQTDGTVRDLNDMTSTLRRTRGPAGGHPERGWQLFAFGPFDALAPVGGALGGLTLAAWVADDRGESDRDLLDDTNDTLVVYAAAFGMAAAQRAIRATVRRRPDGSVDVWDYRIVR